MPAMRFLLIALVTVMTFAAAPHAHADGYPLKPVRVIVGLAPAGQLHQNPIRMK